MNIEKIRQDFPILQKRIAYIDSACMALKPRQVVESMNRYFLEFPACGERSSHQLGRKVTEEYESARKKVAKFINAKEEEAVFTKNTTEGLNLAANCLGLENSDVIVTSDKEHNSNFLPWGRFNRKIIATKEGRFDMEAFQDSMSKDVKVVAVQHSSNIDGMSFSVKEIAKIAHDFQAVVVVDGAQSVPHKETDVKKMGCDVLAFSGHKMLGPSIGCVYINKEIDVKPFMTGGGTVMDVRNGEPQYLKPPQMLEAGLQDYAGAIGLGAAVDYLSKIGLKNIEQHEQELNKKIAEGIASIKNVSILGGRPEERGGVTSFLVKGMDSREVALMLDSYNVLVRGGFHCCHNWFNERKIAGSARASLYLYNNENDVQMLVDAVKKVSSLV